MGYAFFFSSLATLYEIIRLIQILEEEHGRFTQCPDVYIVT
jgi:hypothetical protein